MTTTTTPVEFKFRVTSVQEAQVGTADRVQVNFTHLTDDPSVQTYGQGLSLNLSKEDGAAYFPGQIYTVTLSAAQ